MAAKNRDREMKVRRIVAAFNHNEARLVRLALIHYKNAAVLLDMELLTGSLELRDIPDECERLVDMLKQANAARDFIEEKELKG
jgi:hypothetical protein